MPVDHSKNIVEVANVSFSYGKTAALENVTLSIHQGDYMALVGGNGAGKTTLIKVILNLIKPDRGEVKIFGVPVTRFKDWHKLGYVPQKSLNTDRNFPATVFGVVQMGRFAHHGLWQGLTTKDDEKTKDALIKVGIWHMKDRMIGDLSGGEEQKVYIARALATEPEIVFLDEPTRGLDQKTQEELYVLFKKLNREYNLTIVVVTHDIERVVGEAMHVACIERTLTCHMTPEEFLKASMYQDVAGKEIRITTHHHHH